MPLTGFGGPDKSDRLVTLTCTMWYYGIVPRLGNPRCEGTVARIYSASSNATRVSIPTDDANRRTTAPVEGRAEYRV